MINAIICFKFVLAEDEEKVIPRFDEVIKLIHDKKLKEAHISELITVDDLFGLFYQHTTGLFSDQENFSNFHTGRLKSTSFRISSHYHQVNEDNQFITISFFDLNDEIEIFEDFVKNMNRNLEKLFRDYIKFTALKRIDDLLKVKENIESEMKLAIFQIERLANLDKIQKAALIFQSDERLKILEILRERPVSRRELIDEMEKISTNPNLDLLLEPFLELNLIRRDWMKGSREKRTGIMRDQGEFLFLVKDITFARLPSEEIIKTLQKNNQDLYQKYKEKVKEFFIKYKITNQTEDDLKDIASVLLNPDTYDFFRLLRKNYYPLKKLPKIFSDFVDSKFLMDRMEYLKISCVLKDKPGEEWVVLLTDIKPIIAFPEFLLPKLRSAVKTTDKEKKISIETAKKALQLLEVTYPEEIEF